MKKTALLCVLTACLTFGATAQGIQFEEDLSFQQILDKAKKQDKLIFMDCYTTWCGPCKRLAAQVFPDPEVGTYYNATFINTKFDMEKGEGVTLASRYGIRAYPTLLWIDGTGEVVHKVVGGLDPQGLIAAGKKAADPAPGILQGMKKQYDAGNRDISFLADYVSALGNAGEKNDAVLTELIGKLSAKELGDAKYIKSIFNATGHLKSPGMKMIQSNRDNFVNTVGIDAFNQKMTVIANKAAADAAKEKNNDLFNEAAGLMKSLKMNDAEAKMLSMSLDYYAKTNDWANYDKNASAYIKKYAAKNAAVLNDVAWNYYLNVTDATLLKKAAKWALEAVNTDNKYTYNLTYAYLLYKLNDTKEAIKACDYAILRAKEENVQPSSALSLKDVLQKDNK